MIEKHRRVKLSKLTSHLLPSAFVLTGALGCAAYSQANPAAIAEAVLVIYMTGRWLKVDIFVSDRIIVA